MPEQSALVLVGNIVGMVGMVALARPALRANNAAKSLYELGQISIAEGDAAYLKELVEFLKKDTESKKVEWKPFDGWLLFIGYAGLSLSYLVRFLI